MSLNRARNARKHPSKTDRVAQKAKTKRARALKHPSFEHLEWNYPDDENPFLVLQSLNSSSNCEPIAHVSNSSHIDEDSGISDDVPSTNSSELPPVTLARRKPRILMTPGGTSTLPPNLLGSPGASSCLPTVPNASSIANIDHGGVMKPPKIVSTDWPKHNSRFFPSPHFVSYAGPFLDSRPNEEKALSRHGRIPLSANERDLSIVSNASVQGSPKLSRSHILDVASFLRLGHSRNCWCGKATPDIEYYEPQLDADNWIVYNPESAIKIQSHDVSSIADVSCPPSPSSQSQEWIHVDPDEESVELAEEDEDQWMCVTCDLG